MTESYKRYILEEWSLPELKIWMVDGKEVRDTRSLEFVVGGHDLVYSHFILQNEIWIDSLVSIDELPFNVVHEVYERWLMSIGLDYDSAHEMANKFEKILRDKGDICVTSAIIKNFMKRNVENIKKSSDQQCLEVGILVLPQR